MGAVSTANLIGFTILNSVKHMTAEDAGSRFAPLVNITQSLQKYATSATPNNFGYLLEQYNQLRDQVISIDIQAKKVLPFLMKDSSLEETRLAIEQLTGYVTYRGIPHMSKLFTDTLQMFSPFIRFQDSLSSLSPFLTALGLGNNWAVGATALSLFEVMITRKLNELKLAPEGSFDARVKRLSEEAKRRGAILPDLLAGGFYNARSKVLHSGKEPTAEELKLVIDYLTTLSATLNKLH